MNTNHATVVTMPVAYRMLIWGGFPLLGGGAGWLVKVVVDWAATLPWTPFERALLFLSSLPDPQAMIGAVVLGVVAGLVLTFLAVHDYVNISVGDDGVAITQGDSRREVPRAAVGAVFLDGKQLVLLGHETEELARTTGDLPAADVEAAFVRHGYPWLAGDPHRDEFRRWVDGHPDLPVAAHAYFRARARALEKDERDDADELRDELAGLGIVVRDEGKRQYWRARVTPPEDGL